MQSDGIFQGIPDKGKLLTKISLFWFNKLHHIIPNHFVTATIDEMPEEIRKYKDQLDGRTMLVRKAEVIPLEAIVRGYIVGTPFFSFISKSHKFVTDFFLLGSAWSEYKKFGTVHSIPMPAGLVEGQKLPKPLFTPSTKAEQGAHDENISPEQGKKINVPPSFSETNTEFFFIAAKLIGQDLYDKISSVALRLYEEAADYAQVRGVILADTKFEFGHVSNGLEKELILIDELLTPDSSRYWPLEEYAPGKAQPSFDKQYVRDWLVSAGYQKGLESGPAGKEGQGWFIDEKIVKGTQERYAEAVNLLVG